MQEIRDIPWNGYKVVSTFSGGGGSCLGYRMAGYRVLWANEFIPAAQETYKANHPDSFLDTRDIREIQPTDIFKATGLGVGEIDIFDGSPPCSAFSTAGSREKGWGTVKQYSDSKQRVDDLFFEYARLIKETQPKVFVAENVSGLIKGSAKGYFLEILKTLKGCGYEVKCRLLDAQWLGVPQARQRTIFVGVRSDLVGSFGVLPAHPSPLSYRYTVKDAIPWIGGGDDLHPLGIVEAESDISKYAIGKEWIKLREGEQSSKYFQLVKQDRNKPSGTITQRGGDASVASITHPTEPRKFSISELRRICAFPDDFKLTGTYARQWERMGRAVPPVMMMHVARSIQKEVLDKC
jgi:DNA (cytosine-5)-methyltransferase 1